MGERLPTQLETLQRERVRMEELLMLDANWRALRQLDEREAAGEPVEAIDAADLRESLVAVLGGNRLFAARAKLIETIELLSAAPPDHEEAVVRATGVLTGAPRLASRIVLLTSPGTESFRARVRMKVSTAGETDHAGTSVDAEVSVATVVPIEAAPLRQVDGHATAVSAPAVPDALELIDGLGRCAVEVLQSHGVTRFSEIGNWTSAEAAVWRARLDGLAEGHPSTWIEQAAVLAAGRDTHYAARVRRGEFACLVKAPAPEPVRPSLSPVMPDDPVVKPFAASLPPEPVVPESLATEPLSPEPLPAVVSSGPPARAGARLVSAAELAMVLAKSAPPTSAVMQADVEGPDPARRDPKPADMPPLSKLSFHRRGFKRPAALIEDGFDVSAVGDSEVIVIAREAPSEAEVVPPSNVNSAKPAPRLLRRLKQIEREENFSADGYAAYRGEVEEASVTIIRSEDGPAFVRRPPVRPPVEEQRKVSRFLRALTGKT